MSSFRQKTDDFKNMVMDEYLNNEITQKELGAKYGFCYRRIARWFREANRVDEYLNKQKKNIDKSCRRPMPSTSKIKISGINNIRWNGEKIEIKYGQISAILTPSKDHPNANSQGYVYKHRLVIEDSIGRFLTEDEKVHHIDLDPTNNDITNLLVMSDSEHASIHYLLQVALVQLLSKEQLRQLTEQLLEQLRGGLKPLQKGAVKGCALKPLKKRTIVERIHTDE